MVLKLVRVLVIVASKLAAVNVVRLELNCAETSNIRNNVSGSTITGVIEATVNGARSRTNRSFSTWGIKLPVVDLIDIKTFPNSWTELTPNTGSKEPVSPPKIDTDCVLGKNLFMNSL